MVRDIRKCRVCGASNLRRFYVLKNYPLIAGPVTTESRAVPTVDLPLGFCGQCGVASLLGNDIDDLRYDDDYTSSNIAYGRSAGMDALTTKFLQFVGEAQKPKGSRVLEIGCYDGSFMTLMANEYGYNVSGCEPSEQVAAVARKKGLKVEVAGFTATAGLDMIVARNVLEHIPEPANFLRDVSWSLAGDGAFVAEIPNGEYCIARGIIGVIVPEHPCYYSENGIVRLLRLYFGRVAVHSEGAILRIRASVPSRKRNRVPQQELRRHYLTFAMGGITRQRRLAVAGNTVTKRRKIGIFGANTCALELLATGTIRVEQIQSVFDDDPRRWGKYLVNTGIRVLPREAVKDSVCAEILVCSYTHRHQIAEYIASQKRTPIVLYDEKE